MFVLKQKNRNNELLTATGKLWRVGQGQTNLAFFCRGSIKCPLIFLKKI